MSQHTKVAIVSGASRGIGAALVPAYRKLGYAVVATARSVEPTDDPEVLTVAADIAEPGSGARIVDAALQRFGRVDTLINNAGIFIAKPFTEYTDDALARLHPLGRMGDIDDVVDAILYLENASFVTGEVLHVDGGQSAGH